MIVPYSNKSFCKSKVFFFTFASLIIKTIIMSRLFVNLSSLAFVLIVCLFTFNVNAQEGKENKDAEKVDKWRNEPVQCLIGEDALKKLLAENLKYPQEAKEKGIQGAVLLSIFIEPDGSISDVNVEKGIGYGLDEEAIKLAKLVKKWTPAIEKGINVRAKYDLPVKFILSENNKESVDFIGLYDHDNIYTYTEMPARFPGGENALEKYIEAVMNYPKEAKEKNIKGRVFLSFIVERDGSLSDIKLVSKLGFGCDEEAIRIVKTMPNWEPAQQNKHIIRYRATLPVTFKLRKTQNN